MLAAHGHRDGGLDILDETWKRWCEANDEGGDSAPVGAVFAVSVDAVEVVQIRYTDTTAADDVVIGDQNGCHWTKEDRVACNVCDQLLFLR